MVAEFGGVIFLNHFPGFDGSEILPKLKSRVPRGWPSRPRMWSWTYTAVFPITRRNFKALRHPVYVGLNCQVHNNMQYRLRIIRKVTVCTSQYICFS